MSKFLRLEINPKSDEARVVVNVVLGDPTTNGPLAKDADAAAKELADSGQLAGKVVLVYGRAMVPVGAVLGHRLAHVTKAVLVYAATDNRFIVVTNHDGSYTVGDEHTPESFGLTPSECGYRPPQPKPTT